MKILLLAELVTYSGVGTYIKTLSEELLSYGDEVHILSARFDLDLDPRIQCHSFLPLKRSNFISNYNIFKKTVKQYKIEIVHIQHRIVGIYPRIYNLLFEKVPCTYILHTGRLDQNNCLKRIFTYGGRRTIAISSEVRECCIRQLGIKEEKIVTVLNGVKEDSLLPMRESEKQQRKNALGIPQDAIVLCMHGRIDRVKGHDILLDALCELPPEIRDRLHIVVSGKTEGNVYYDALKEKVDRLSLTRQFSFIGWCRPEDILGISDLMVQPSRREGFPLSSVEAFFMKVPVIRTRTGGYEDMEDCCIGISTEDPHGLAEEIGKFVAAVSCGNTQFYEDMVARAYHFANENCSIKAMTARTRKVFSEIVHEN